MSGITTQLPQTCRERGQREMWYPPPPPPPKWQLQEKGIEQQMPLESFFVLTKAFDLISRESLFLKIIQKFSSPSTLDWIISHGHEGDSAVQRLFIRVIPHWHSHQVKLHPCHYIVLDYLCPAVKACLQHLYGWDLPRNLFNFSRLKAKTEAHKAFIWWKCSSYHTHTPRKNLVLVAINTNLTPSLKLIIQMLFCHVVQIKSMQICFSVL